MSGNDAFGSGSAEVSDWTRAWEAVSRLAAAAPLAFHDIRRDRRLASIDPAPVPHILPVTEETRDETDRRIGQTGDPDQLARAIAEIEKAAAALRRAEPALEPWQPAPEAIGKHRNYLSIWVLIGAVWISAILLIAGTTGTIVYLFG